MIPDLKQIQRRFNGGETNSLRALAQHFECDKLEILQHMTARNGFKLRQDGKQEVYDFNPALEWMLKGQVTDAIATPAETT